MFLLTVTISGFALINPTIDEKLKIKAFCEGYVDR